MRQARWVVIALASALTLCATAFAQTPLVAPPKRLSIPGDGVLSPYDTIEFQRPIDCPASCPDRQGLDVVSESLHPLSVRYDGVRLTVSVSGAAGALVNAAITAGCGPVGPALIVPCALAPGRGRPFPIVVVTTVAVSEIPRLEVTSLPERGLVGRPVAYTVNVLPPTVAASVSVMWDFDDGTSAEGMSVTHVFAVAGQYTVHAAVVLPQPLGGTKTERIDAAVPVPRFPQLAAAGGPCPLTQSMCDFARRLTTAFIRGDAATVLALWQPMTVTCDEDVIRDADVPGLICYGAQPGDEQQAYPIIGGDTDCGPACIGVGIDRGLFAMGVQELAAEAQADELDGYGPGDLRLLGILSPLAQRNWGQDDENQFIILMTDVAPFDEYGPRRTLFGILVQADDAGNPLYALALISVALSVTELDQFTPPGMLSEGFLPWTPPAAPGTVQQAAPRLAGRRLETADGRNRYQRFRR